MKPAADIQYIRHDRFWIPLEPPEVMNFYLRYLLIPHSRKELLQANLLRKASHRIRLSLLARNVPDPESQSRLEESICVVKEKGAGSSFPPDPSFLVLEDYRQSVRGQKIFFIFGENSSEPAAVAKLSFQGNALAEEFKALLFLQESLNNTLRKTIPTPLFFDQDDSLALLIESFLPGRSIYSDMRNRLNPQRLLQSHFSLAGDWLAQFHRATHKRSVRLQEVWEEVFNPAQQLLNCDDLSPFEKKAFQDTQQLAREMRQAVLPMVCRQGDFWARNFLLNAFGNGVVDWEHFHSRGAPFYDLFLFSTSYGLNFPFKPGHWKKPAAAFRATYLEKGRLAETVREYLLSYCRSMEIPLALMEAFFPVFLAERVLLEKKASEAGAKFEKTWKEILREYSESVRPGCFLRC